MGITKTGGKGEIESIMKKKYLKVVCIGLVLMMCSLTACSETRQPSGEIVSESAVTSESDVTSESASGDNVQSENPETDSEPDEDIPKNTLGGKPWLDTDLKENISADLPTSAKDDFYWYVNKDWLLSAEIDPENGGNNTFYEVSKKTNERALAILTDDSLEGENVKLVQDLFNAVLDWDARDELGLAPAEETIKDINAIQNMDELAKYWADAEKGRFIPKPIVIKVGVGLVDSSVYVTKISPGAWLLEDAAEYTDRTEIGDSIYNSSLQVAKDLLTRLGYSEEEAQKMFEDTIAFETLLSEKASTNADRGSTDFVAKNNNYYTPDEIKKLCSKFPLYDYITDAGFGASKEFMIGSPAAIMSLDELYTEDNLETFKEYMIVRYLVYNAQDFDSKAYRSVCGEEASLDNKTEAFNIVRANLTAPMDRAYLEAYDQTEKKERIQHMCRDIIAAYRDMLSEEDWLSDETREKAIEKLDNMTINAVYPEEWPDYSSMDLTGLGYYDCLNEIFRFKEKNEKSRINAKVDNGYWDTDILTANASYMPNENSITILLGYLEEPIYYDGMSDEELYAFVGVTIGHEISHAFDPTGSQFDKDGNYADWWTDEDHKAFEERAKKQIAYYDNITAWEGQNIPGELEQGEAIADMAGMKVILSIAKEKENFDYDAFFTSYAKLWRRINTRETEYRSILRDTHPVHYLRTNVTLQQFDEFYETYDVKEGDGMYLALEDRVIVW